MSNSSQVFQTKSSLRWESVKWTTRIFLILAAFLLVVLGFALYSGSIPSLPNLEAQSKDYQNTLDPAKPLTLANNLNKKYNGFKQFLIRKEKEDANRRVKTLGGNNA